MAFCILQVLYPLCICVNRLYILFDMALGQPTCWDLDSFVESMLWRIHTSIVVPHPADKRPRILLILTLSLNQRLMHILDLIRVSKLPFLLWPLNILRVSQVLFFIHTFQHKISVLTLIVATSLFLIMLIVLDFAINLCFLPNLLILFVVHIPMIVLVDFLHVDGFMFCLDLHEFLVSVLYLRDDKLHDHLLL